MNILITVISMILFLVLIINIYGKLSDIDKKKKILIIFIEIIICFIFSMVIVKGSSLGIVYPNDKDKGIVIQTLIMIFTPINGIIILPNITKIVNKIQNEGMEIEEFSARLKKIGITLIILLIIEIIYLRNIQNGIISIYGMKNN